MTMNPYDIAVIFGNEDMCCHQVWAANETEAKDAIMFFYRESTVVGIIFAAND
ncbi:MAG: hypothetical protein ACK5P0_01555 [bacterium]